MSFLLVEAFSLIHFYLIKSIAHAVIKLFLNLTQDFFSHFPYGLHMKCAVNGKGA